MITYLKKQKLAQLVEEALSDGVLTSDEIREIETRRVDLGLPRAFVDQLRDSHYHAELDPIIKRIRRARRFYESDIAEIAAISNRLQVSRSFDGETFRIAKTLASIEQTGEFKPHPIQAPIQLNPDEQCFHGTYAMWAPSANVYVASNGATSFEHVTLRLADSTPPYAGAERAEDFDKGDLYITNKRFVFVGARRSTAIQLDQVAHRDLYRDAIVVTRSISEPADIFRMDPEHVEYFDAILQVV